MQPRINLLGEIGQYIAACLIKGRIPETIANALPLVQFMGDNCGAWLLFWQAGNAIQRLAAIYTGQGIDSQNTEAKNELLSQNKNAAFYDGKIRSARFFIKNVLPQVDGVDAATKNEDASLNYARRIF